MEMLRERRAMPARLPPASPARNGSRRGSSAKASSAKRTASAHIETSDSETIDKRSIPQSPMRSNESECIMTMTKLKAIPVMTNPTRLHRLDCSCNELTKLDNLEKCYELKELIVYDNKLQTLDGLKNCRQLEVIHAQYNKIAKLGPFLNHCSRLRELRIEVNELTVLCVEDISVCAKLTFLDVSFNALADIDAVSCLVNLEELRASNNHIRKLPDLSRLKLTDVVLSNNELEDLGALKGQPLQMLDVSNNKLSHASLVALGDLKKLLDLNVANNQIDQGTAFLRQFPVIESLNISHNPLSPDEYQMLRSLKSIRSIKADGLSANPVEAAGSANTPVSAEQQSAKPVSDIDIEVKNFKDRQASSMNEVRKHLDESIKNVEMTESLLSVKFTSVRLMLDQLPNKPPQPQPRNDGGVSTRSRLKAARDFCVTIETSRSDMS